MRGGGGAGGGEGGGAVPPPPSPPRRPPPPATAPLPTALREFAGTPTPRPRPPWRNQIGDELDGASEVREPGVTDVGGLRRLALGLLPIGVALLPASAWSATPCLGDIEKYCADVPTGGGRIQACLEKHAHELSPGCA